MRYGSLIGSYEHVCHFCLELAIWIFNAQTHGIMEPGHTIGKHLVRLGDLFESSVRLVLVVRILVGMPFEGQFSIPVTNR